MDKIVKIAKYRTSDGSEFDTIDEAHNYELTLEIKQKIFLYCNHATNWRNCSFQLLCCNRKKNMILVGITDWIHS